MILPATNVQDAVSRLIVETLLHGIQLVLYIATVYFLATRRTLASGNVGPKHHFFSLPFCGVSTLFFFSSLHWITEVYAKHTAVAHLADEAHGNNVFTPPELAIILEVISLAVTFFLGDCLVVYRLWIIWDKGRRIMIFHIGCLTDIAASSAVLYLVIRSTLNNPYSSILSNSPAKLFLVFAFVFSLVYVHSKNFNQYLIEFQWQELRVYPKKSNLTPISSSQSCHTFEQFFLVIVIESAAIQTLWLVLSPVTILSGAHAAYIMPGYLTFSFTPGLDLDGRPKRGQWHSLNVRVESWQKTYPTFGHTLQYLFVEMGKR
ncbi:hypothetical protein R3P38DRAFT_2792314 [Favolaschia claudopus]|uniref:Uncharacterized protein n=1 Tax=Favolaschia claudopus TaxID=2862362 RepID=A0AAW0AF10_9AGAR